MEENKKIEIISLELKKIREENNKDLKEIDKRLEIIEYRIDKLDKRIENELRSFDKRLADIETRIAISNYEFAKLKKYMQVHEIRLDLHGYQIEKIEKWKDEMNKGLLGV